MCCVCFVYYRGFNWNYGWGSIIITFLILVIYLYKHSCGHRRQWRRWYFQSTFSFFKHLLSYSNTVRAYMLSRQRETEVLVQTGHLTSHCPAPPDLKLVFCSCHSSWAVAWWCSTPSWCLPSLHQGHCKELCGFSQPGLVQTRNNWSL